MTHIRTKPKSVYKKSRHNPSHSSDSSNSSPVHGQQDHHSNPSPLNAFYKSGPAFGLNPPVQTKVEVGKANDPYEREADRVSDHVKAGVPAPAISKLPAGGLSHSPQRKENTEEKKEPPVQKKEEEKKEPPVQKKEEEKKEPPVQKKEEEKKEPPVQKKEEEKKEPSVQKKEEEKKEEPVQKEAASGGSSHTSHGAEAASHAINSKGPGSPLSPSTQNALESSMGTDLSNVRVHNDNKANDAARALDARAFTHQNDIWLGKGASPDDVGLMAHEAAHVVQQTGAVQRKIVQRDGTPGAPAAPAAAPAGNTSVLTSDNGTIDTVNKKISIPAISLSKKGGKSTSVPKPLIIPKAPSRPSDQRDKWRNEVKGAGVNKKVEDKLPDDKAIPSPTGEKIFYLKLLQQKSFIIGNRESVKSQVVLPNWSPVGANCQFDVDHIREMQLGGENVLSNYQLLDAETNRSSGSKIKGEITKRIREAIAPHVGAGKQWTKAPNPDDIRSTYNEIKFENVTDDLDVKGPDISWSVKQVNEDGAHLEALEILDATKVEEYKLRGSPTQLALYMSAAAGAPKKVKWDPAGGNSQSFNKENWEGIKGFDLTNITYQTGTGGTITGNVFNKNKTISGGSLTMQLEDVQGVPYTARINASSLRGKMRNLLSAKKASPIEIFDADFLENGLDARGVINTTLPFLKGAKIDIQITGSDVMFSKTFSSSDFSFPGPVKITNADLTFAAGTLGLQVSGEVAFEIERVGKGKLGAVASSGTGEGGSVELHGEFEFDTKLFDEAKITMDYKNNKFSGTGTLKIGTGKIKGIKSASIDVKVDGESWSADGKVTPDIPGIKEGTLSAKYAKEKGFEFGGSLVLADNIPGIKGGSMNATLTQISGGQGYALKGSGTLIPKIPGVNTTITAQYDDGAFSAEGTVAYEKGMLKGSITLGVTNLPVGEGGKPAGEPTKKLTAYGGGTVTIRIAPWLQGTIGIKLLPNGEVEVSGTVGLPSAIDIFPEKKLDKNIFSINLDIPIVGVAVAGQRIGIFATIGGGLDLSAGIGPGQLRDASLGVTYNPAHEEDTKVSGKASFVIPMNAGLRLFVRGALGAGIPIVSATAGLEIGGQLGLAGEARADVSVDWSPAKGLSMEAMGSIMVEPKFKFDITGFVKVEADLLLTTIELYSKRWQLAAFEYGSGLKFGVKFPIKYQEGKPFDISFSDVEFVYPKIDTDALLKDLIKKIA